MKKYEAIGVIETQYFAVAMELLDHASKSAHIEFLSSEKYLGGRLVSLIIGGSIADVKEAIRIVEQVAEKKSNRPLKNAVVITNPHEEILQYIISPNKRRKSKEKRTKKVQQNKKQKEKEIVKEDNEHE